MKILQFFNQYASDIITVNGDLIEAITVDFKWEESANKETVVTEIVTMTMTSKQDIVLMNTVRYKEEIEEAPAILYQKIIDAMSSNEKIAGIMVIGG